jgi:transposase InsO family protein
MRTTPYRDALKALGAVARVSRKGDCWDNAVAESFFTIKGEMIDDEEFETRAEAHVAVSDYMMHSTTSPGCTRQSAT